MTKFLNIGFVCSGLFLIPYIGLAQDLVKQSKPVNIILMIADGVGINQMSGSLYHFNHELLVEKMPFIGLQKTNSFNSLNTDPAAAITAIACGVKSFDGAIGVNMDSVSMPSMVKIGADNKMKTGVVTTASMTHLSSAAFWAHSSVYKNEEHIASQLPGSPLDLIIGGGEKFFIDREDKKNMIMELQAQGYQTLSILPEAKSFLTADITKKYAAFTAFDLPLTVIGGRKYLSSAVSFAMDFLNTKDEKNDGFFLVVNSAQIAMGAKLNNPDYMLSEYNDFDETLAKVLEFAERDKETLVIVTSAYEIGGYSVNPGSKLEKLQHEFTGKSTTGTLVPVFSKGPGAIKFTGFFENIDFLPKLKDLFGWN